jgi:hypothetical protein
MAGIRSARFLSLCAVAALCLPASSKGQVDVPAQAHKIKTGRKVEVALKSGEILKGRMGANTNEGFTLEPTKVGTGAPRAISYDQLNSVRATGLSTRDKWIIFAVVWVVAGAIGKAAM